MAQDNQIYDPDQYFFRSDGTVVGPNGSEQAVVVPDPDGSLRALSGQGGGGNGDGPAWAVVPQSVADKNGLTVTSEAQPDPDFNSSGGLGDVLQIVAPIALSYFGAPWLAAAFGGGATASAAAGAIIGGSSSLITGGDPLKGALMGGAGGLLGSAMGGADAADGFSSFDNADAFGPGSMSGGVPGTTAAAGDLVNQADISGVPTGGQEFMQVASAPQATMTDYQVGSGDVGATQTGNDFSPFDNADAWGPGSQLGGVVKTDGQLGITERILNWGQKNQAIATGLVQTAGGIIGGIGQGLLKNSDTEKQIQAAKDLTAMKTDEQIRAEAAKKAAIQSGSYFDANVPIKPSGQPLRRPDGSLVYQNGLIARAQAR